MSRQDTTQLQHWMKELITTQGSMQHKLQRARQLHGLGELDVVAETRDVSVYSRMHVYTSGYVLRLLECITADFPVLRKFMGDNVFDQFAKASLLWSPPTSYSLYDLGTTFIRFLEATRPKDMPEEQSVFLDLPVEIARAERAQHEVIRSKGMEGSPQAELFPDDILFYGHTIGIEASPCLRLLELKFPVKQFFDGLHSDGPFATPAPAKTFFVVSRINYRITIEELEEWQFVFLQKCGSPSALTDIINETAVVTGIPAATLLADMCIWLPVFQQKGFVVLNNGAQ